MACEILVPPPGVNPYSCIGSVVFTTGLPGKSHYGLNFECEGKIIFKDDS